MSAVSIEKFFKLLDFFETNRYVSVFKNFQDAENRMDDYPSYNLYQEVLKLNGIDNFSLTKDSNIITTALQARYKTRKFFIKTMIPGSYAFNTKDMDMYREMIIDWAAAIKTQKDLMRQCVNAYALDDDDIDKAIKGFGIDWCNKKSTPKLMSYDRARFLYAICELYKIKGSPISITRALQYMGIPNAVIREHWTEKVPYIDNQIQIRAVAASKHIQQLNFSEQKYESVYKGSADDVIIPWDTFLNKLQEIADPHWWYKHDEIVDLDNDPNTWLKLPSLMPYFGIISYNDLNKYNLTVSFLEKILDDQFNQFLHGDKEYIPQEIGLDGFNQELNQRKIQIDGFSDPLTLLEAYLAFTYCQIRYDEYVAFKRLRDFILEHQVHPSKSMPMEYNYPYGYLNLIYELYQHRNDFVNDTPVTIDMILKQYPGDLSHYYLSNNEFFKWWDENHASEDFEQNARPFYSYDYQFRIIKSKNREECITDTKYDKILRYNGTRELDYRKSDFQYDEALGDFARDANQKLNRGTQYDDFKSYYPSNSIVTNDKKLGDYLFDHIATYFRNISEYTKEYTENYEHDGSYLTPTYLAKWPETKSWNWAIDSYFYYMSYTPTKWARWSVESFWNASEEGAYVSPKSGPVNVTFVGEYFYHDQYVYAYVSTNKWVRWVVETDWGYCDGPVKPDGSFRSDNDFSKQFIVGQIDKYTTDKYLNNNLEQGIDRISLVVDPYEIRSTTKSVTLSVVEFQDYLIALDAHVDINGNLIKNTLHFKHDQFIYSYVYDIATKSYRWVRKPCETEWNYNGYKVYQGEYHFPGLDLTDRYDAERILRGQYVFNLNELNETDPEELIKINEQPKVLVCQPDNESSNPLDKYPRSYEFDGTNWLPTRENELDKIRLGFNNKIMDWIDNVRCVEEEMYGELADEIMAVTSNYISIQFQDSELNVAGIYKDIANKGLYHDAIEFYKPKRARLLYFSVEFSIDTRIDNSLFLEDIPETTKIIHEIQDHVPHDDLIYLNNQRREQDNSRVRNEATVLSTYKEKLPSLSQYEFYIGDCPHQFVNGFYKKIENDDGSFYWINDHNVVIQRILNTKTLWSGEYYAEWIIARRKITGLSRCDAWYLNYINKERDNFNDPATDNQQWFLKGSDPDIEEPYSFKLIKIKKITKISHVNREHRLTTGGPYITSNYDFNDISVQLTTKTTNKTDNEISWNTLFPRDNSLIEQVSQFTIDPLKVDPAYCIDEIRPLWPNDNQLAAAPESISGGRYDDADYDQSTFDNYNKEYRHDFRDIKGYPYTDTLIINDGASTEFEQVKIRDLNSYYSTPNYLIPRFIVGKTTANVQEYVNAKFQIFKPQDLSDVQVYVRKSSNGTSVAINPLTGVPNGFTLYTKSYTIDIANSKIIFNEPVTASNYEILIVSKKPGRWWINDPLDWKTGAGHRPAYIGIKDNEDDPYPCHDWADCCDYYDTGCRHDGPTNPHVEIWTPTKTKAIGHWTECLTAHGHLIDCDYDEWTHHHKEVGYIDRLPDTPFPFDDNSSPRKQAIEHYESEMIHGRLLEDPGDTYCNECGVPAISPDQTTRLLPEILKSCGVYHEILRHDSRDDSEYFKNIRYWQSWYNGNPYSVIKDDKNNYFDYGYVSNDGNYQLRHAFNKTTATHLWEVTTTETNANGDLDILYTTKPRPISHLPEEVENQPYTWVSRPDAFVEGTECDVAEDTFLDSDGEISSLFFTNNTIAAMRIKNSPVVLPPDYDLWTLTYIKQTDTTGYVQIRTPDGWKQIDQIATTIDIQEDDPNYNGPKDTNNYFGYWLRKQESANKYDLYLYVSCEDRIGWVVLNNVKVQSSLTDYGDTYNNDWIARSRTLYKVCHMKLEDPNYELSDDTHYCADPIHYAETYDGAMLAAFGKNRTRCTVREKVFTNIYDYCTTIQTLLDNEEPEENIYYRKIWQFYQQSGQTRYRINFLKLNDNHKDEDPPTGWEFCDSLIYRISTEKFKQIMNSGTIIYVVDANGAYYQFEAEGFEI